MILLLKYYFNKNIISTSSIIMFFSFLIVLGYFYIPLLLTVIICDLYMFTILTNFRIKKTKSNPSNCKIEIVAEGQQLSKTDDLAKTLMEYDTKLNS